MTGFGGYEQEGELTIAHALRSLSMSLASRAIDDNMRRLVDTAQKEGFAAGHAASLGRGPAIQKDPAAPDGEAFNNSFAKGALIGSGNVSRETLSGLAQQHANNPDGFRSAAAAAREKLFQTLPPTERQMALIDFQEVEGQYGRQIAAVAQKQRMDAAAASTMALIDKSAANMAAAMRNGDVAAFDKEDKALGEMLFAAVSSKSIPEAQAIETRHRINNGLNWQFAIQNVDRAGGDPAKIKAMGEAFLANPRGSDFELFDDAPLTPEQQAAAGRFFVASARDAQNEIERRKAEIKQAQRESEGIAENEALIKTMQGAYGNADLELDIVNKRIQRNSDAHVRLLSAIEQVNTKRELREVRLAQAEEDAATGRGVRTQEAADLLFEADEPTRKQLPAEQRAGSLVHKIAQWGWYPKEAEASLSSELRAGAPAYAIQAANMIVAIDDINPAVQGIDEKTKSMARMVYRGTRSASESDPLPLIEFARKAVYGASEPTFKQRAVELSRNENGKGDMPTRNFEASLPVITRDADSILSGGAEISPNVANDARATYTGFFSQEYHRTGDDAVAREYAERQTRAVFAPSAVGTMSGKAELTSMPVERSVWAIPGLPDHMQSPWMQEQLQNEVHPKAVLFEDPLATRRNQDGPRWKVAIPNGTGGHKFIYNDKGEIATWHPQYDKSPAALRAKEAGQTAYDAAWQDWQRRQKTFRADEKNPPGDDWTKIRRNWLEGIAK